MMNRSIKHQIDEAPQTNILVQVLDRSNRLRTTEFTHIYKYAKRLRNNRKPQNFSWSIHGISIMIKQLCNFRWILSI